MGAMLRTAVLGREKRAVTLKPCFSPAKGGCEAWHVGRAQPKSGFADPTEPETGDHRWVA